MNDPMIDAVLADDGNPLADDNREPEEEKCPANS